MPAVGEISNSRLLVRAGVVDHKILVGVSDDHIAIQQQCRTDRRIELAVHHWGCSG